MCLTLVVGRVHAQYYSVNYDKQIVAAMAAAFGAGAMAESYYNEQVGEILKHYNAAEVATAGIFAAKFLERKALSMANPLGIGNRCMPLATKVQNLLIADFLNYLAMRHQVYLSTMDEVLKKNSKSKP